MKMQTELFSSVFIMPKMFYPAKCNIPFLSVIAQYLYKRVAGPVNTALGDEESYIWTLVSPYSKLRHCNV